MKTSAVHVTDISRTVSTLSTLVIIRFLSLLWYGTCLIHEPRQTRRKQQTASHICCRIEYCVYLKYFIHRFPSAPTYFESWSFPMGHGIINRRMDNEWMRQYAIIILWKQYQWSLKEIIQFNMTNIGWIIGFYHTYAVPFSSMEKNA